jgi:hypothetical protein
MLAWVIVAILSASQFAASVKAEGARAAVAALVSGGDWPRVMAAIRNGAGDWIALAPELARGADAAHGAQLTAALAQALPRAPADVLAVVDLRRSPIIGVQAVCGGAPQAETREALELLPDVAAVGRAKAVCLKELALAAPN